MQGNSRVAERVDRKGMELLSDMQDTDAGLARTLERAGVRTRGELDAWMNLYTAENIQAWFECIRALELTRTSRRLWKRTTFMLSGALLLARWLLSASTGRKCRCSSVSRRDSS